MKQNKLSKKIMTIYIEKHKSPKIKRKAIEAEKDTNNYLTTKFELINKILNQKMNLICFDCRKKTPKYISINNAIFLCSSCANIHKKNFTENISLIIDNNLNLLSMNYLNYLYYGGNLNLDNFINYVFPGLQNYPPQILYKTQALNYYRDLLKYKIKEGPEPICPNELMAYKIVSEKGLINIRDKNNIYHDLNITLDNSNVNNNNDIIRNYYNNYNNTYNTYNSINISSNTLENDKNNNLGNSLSNKAFFNEMKILFGNKKSKMKNYDTCKNLTPDKDFKNFSKKKLKKINRKIRYIRKPTPLTDRLNVSFNSSYNKNSSKILNISNYKKSAIPFINNKKHINLDNNLNISPRYIKPSIRYIELNNKYKENEVKIIYNKKKKFNNQIQQINNLKYIKNQKKPRSFCKSNKENKNINNIVDDKKFYDEIFLNKINKNKIKNLKLINLTNEYTNNNDLSNIIKKENNIYLNHIKYHNNYNKKNKIPLRNNNMNVSFDCYNKIRPIKVNLKMNIDRKIKALKDKKEQEKLEQEAMHNIYFDSLNNKDIFSNIIYLNKTNEN